MTDDMVTDIGSPDDIRITERKDLIKLLAGHEVTTKLPTRFKIQVGQTIGWRHGNNLGGVAKVVRIKRYKNGVGPDCTLVRAP